MNIAYAFTIKIIMNGIVAGICEYERSSLTDRAFKELKTIISNYNRNLAGSSMNSEKIVSMLMFLNENKDCSNHFTVSAFTSKTAEYIKTNYPGYYDSIWGTKIKTEALGLIELVDEEIEKKIPRYSIIVNLDNKTISVDGFYLNCDFDEYCEIKKKDKKYFDISAIPMTNIDVEHFSFNELDDVIALVNNKIGFRNEKFPEIIITAM